MELKYRKKAGVYIIDLFGEITDSNELRQALNNWLQEVPEVTEVKVILNFAEVSNLHGDALSAIVAFFTSVKKRGGQVALLNVQRSHHIYTCFRMNMGDEFMVIFPSYDDEQEAISSFEESDDESINIFEEDDYDIILSSLFEFDDDDDTLFEDEFADGSLSEKSDEDINGLLSDLSSQSMRKRWRAAKKLEDYSYSIQRSRKKTAIVQAIIEALEKGDDMLRFLIAPLLAELESEEAISALALVLRTARTDKTRVAAAEALIDISSETAVDETAVDGLFFALTKGIGSQDKCAKALGSIGTSAAALALVKAFPLVDDDVREVIAEVLMEFEDLDAQTEEQVQEVLSEAFLSGDYGGMSMSNSEGYSSEQRIRRSVQLERLGRDLTALAREGTLEPVYPREELISTVSQLLSSENNVLLVGKPGVGKNALVAGLSHRIANVTKQIPAPLKERKILECSVIAFHDDVFYAHEFETKTRLIVQQCKKTKTILFFDNIHTAIMAGAYEDNPERTLANLLTPYLDRKELSMIGATTPEGYDFIAKMNTPFLEKFIRVEIEETPPEETVDILRKIKSHYEKKHNVKISGDVLTEPVELAKRFFTWRCFPGKAISLMEEAIAFCLEQRKRRLDKNVFLKVMQKKTGLPENVLSEEEPLPFNEVFEYFSNAIYGQEQAIQPIVDTILMFKTFLNEPPAPLGVFLFIGPTGVGKTFLAQKLAAYLFGSSERLVRFDMSEFAEYDSISKLIGDSSGNKKALLVDEILAHPCSVVLFDEIEKAHKNVFDLLLGIMGEGRLTDSIGRTAIFTNCIIILTSNIGAELYHQPPPPTLLPQSESKPEVGGEQIHAKLQDFFRPEFINRITQIVQFEPLSKEVINRIAQKEIDSLITRLTKSKPSLRVRIDGAVFSQCVEKGYTPEYGARPMKRAVRELLTYPLVRLLSEQPHLTKGEVKVQLNDDGNTEARYCP